MEKIWVLLVAVSYSGLCLAEEEKPWFIGLGVGSAEYDEPAFSERDNLVSFSGGYVFNDIFSVEVSYIDLGSVESRTLPSGLISLTQDTLTLEAKGFTVASIFSWQVAAPLALSAKLGVSVWDIDKQWSGGTIIDNNLASDTGGTETDLFVGVQLQYKISESLSLGLNWDRYKVEDIDIDGTYAKINIHF